MYNKVRKNVMKKRKIEWRYGRVNTDSMPYERKRERKKENRENFRHNKYCE